MDRETAFGLLLAAANVLSQRLFESDRIKISDKYLTKYAKTPAKCLALIHHDLLEYASRFDEADLKLLNLFGEILASMEVPQFTDEPLNVKYLHAYYSQQHALR